MKSKLHLLLITCLITSLSVFAQPSNDNLSGAIPITPSPENNGCSATFTLPFSSDGTTDSGLQGSCNGSGFDQFFSWTATSVGLYFDSQSPGDPGIVIWNADGTMQYSCGSTFSTEVLSGWEIGDNLIIQIYDFQGTSGSDVAFCLELKNITPPPPAPVSFSTQSFTSLGIQQINWAVVDMNGDYLDDIVTVRTTSNTTINVQYQNSGGGFTSVDITTPTPNYSPSWSISAADYDKNGYTDLLYGGGSGVTFMKAEINNANINNGNPFDDVTSFEEVSGNQYVFSQRSNFADINNDGHLDAFVCHDVDPNVYYLNDGQGNLTFNQGGLGDHQDGGDYGSIWIDYDNDGHLDLFIAKCKGSNIPSARVNQMYRNNGEEENPTFTEVAAAIGLDDSTQTWSSAWGDFDNDGDMDLFVGASSGTHKLMRNDIDISGVFTDVTIDSNVLDLTETGHENLAFDFDNDGNLDIVSNGNVLIGHGDLTFTSYENIFPYVNGSFGDLNNDGFIDAVTQSSTGTVYFNNTNSNNWITINTKGTVSNIHGIGARVEVYTASGIQIRDVRSGEGFAFMSTMNTHFGLGSDTDITKIIVKWPSGFIDEILSPAINQALEIIEGDYSLSVQDNFTADLTIYPNPVTNTLNIKSTEDLSDRTATIFDFNGKHIFNKTISNGTIDVSTLQGGLYFLRIESDGKIINRKFLKL